MSRVIGLEEGHTLDSRQGWHRDKQPFMLTFTPTDDLKSPINLTGMYLYGGRKPQYRERTHAHKSPADLGIE